MNILLTAIGSMSADAIISSLREVSGIKLVGCDIYPKTWIPSSGNVDYFYRVPLASDAGYVSEIFEICKKHKIDFIFPLTDPEVDVFVHHIQPFSDMGTTLCLSNINAITISRNKQKLHEYFRNSALIKTIPTYRQEQLSNVKFPGQLIAKIFNGRSSEGLEILRNREETQNKDYSHYIFQPFIKGSIFTVDYIRDSFGNTFSIARKELIRTKNGAGLTVETEENETLTKMTSEIGEKLDILGCINVEYIFDGKDYYLMDINPRFSAGIAFSCMSGYNFPVNNLKCFKKDIIDASIRVPHKIFCKKFIEVVM